MIASNGKNMFVDNKTISVNRFEIIRFNSLEELSHARIIDSETGSRELIVDVNPRIYNDNGVLKEWPMHVWTASRNVSEQGEKTVLQKLYHRLYLDETVRDVGFGISIPEGTYMRIKLSENDKYGLSMDKSGAQKYDKMLREVGL